MPLFLHHRQYFCEYDNSCVIKTILSQICYVIFFPLVFPMTYLNGSCKEIGSLMFRFTNIWYNLMLKFS